MGKMRDPHGPFSSPASRAFLAACLCLACLALRPERLSADGPSAGDFAALGAQAEAQGLDALALTRYGQALALEPGRRDWVQAVERLRAGREALTQGDAETDQAVPASGETLEPGLAAWADGAPEDLAAILNAYNQGAPRGQQVLYVFLPCGRLELAGGRLRLLWDPAPALDLSERLSGDTVVLPLISGSLSPAEPLPSGDWAAVAKDLASRLEGLPRLGGLAFDLEPMPPAARALFADLRQGTDRPLMAVVRPDQAAAYGWVDVALVRGFHAHGDGARPASPALTQALAGAAAASAIALCHAAGRHFFFGLPASATPREFEWSLPAGIPARIPGGGPQSAYFDAALAGLTRLLLRTDSEFLGEALWEVRPEGAATLADGARVWPAAVPESLWERLKTPLTGW